MAASITNVAAPQVASPVPKPVPAAEAKATAPVTEEAVPQVQPIEVNTADSREETQEDIREAAEVLREAVNRYSPSLAIDVDEELNKTIVTVMDADTNEVIRQIPSQDLLDVARAIKRYGVDALGSDYVNGILLDEYS